VLLLFARLALTARYVLVLSVYGGSIGPFTQMEKLRKLGAPKGVARAIASTGALLHFVIGVPGALAMGVMAVIAI
jgi:hypothetical protein